jgi:DNA-binding response OmpR family regulator
MCSLNRMPGRALAGGL